MSDEVKVRLCKFLLFNSKKGFPILMISFLYFIAHSDTELKIR